MILQDLIRNYVMYREVLKPLLESWTDSIVTIYPKNLLLSYNRTDLALKEAVEDRGNWRIPQKSELASLTQMNGTRTITILTKMSMRRKHKIYAGKVASQRASSSKEAFIVLTDPWVNEFTVNIGKTHNQTQSLTIEKTTQNSQKTVSATTGYESKQVNSFLISETHEKREYLGEFSLTHEAIQLSSFWEGGEHHDTDQESITAIV